MSDSPTWSHHNPVRIVCAPLETLGEHVGAEHVLLVTTPGFVKRGEVQRVKNILGSHQVTVWHEVKPNPDLTDLDAASESLRDRDIGCVVGLGGGSAIDAAKVLATTMSNSQELTLRKVFRDKPEVYWTSRLPLIAIPTTSGTGAEVTPFATVWDHEKQKKNSLVGDFVYPDVALLDATLTLSLSEDDTLYPALDAVSHALESLWNKNCTPISRMYAYRALELWNKAFPEIRRNPKNVSVKNQLMMASTLAGVAISQTRTAIAHAISYDLTLRYGIPHGLACSFTLPFLIQENINNITNSEIELSIVEDVKKNLMELDFGRMLRRYATNDQIISRVNNVNDYTRANNYVKIESCITKEIIEGSVQ